MAGPLSCRDNGGPISHIVNPDFAAILSGNARRSRRSGRIKTPYSQTAPRHCAVTLCPRAVLQIGFWSASRLGRWTMGHISFAQAQAIIGQIGVSWPLAGEHLFLPLSAN